MSLSPALLTDRFRAAIFGMAVGDALGFPLRGVPPKAIAQLPQLAEDFSPRPRARFQKGQFSDDTQLMLAVAESVARERKIEGRSIGSHFAWLWREGVLLQPTKLLSDAVQRLLEGVPWMSAGAAMGTEDSSCLSRALVAGLWHHGDPAKLAHDAGVLAIVTHKDPRCAAAAAAYATAVSLAFDSTRRTPQMFCEELAAAASVHDAGFGEELRHLPRVLGWDEDRAFELLRRIGVPSAQLAAHDGLPPNTSPVLLAVIYVVLKVPHDFRAAMRLMLRAGGEVDAACALLGGLLGAHLGLEAIPSRLRKGVLYGQQLEQAADRLVAARTAPAAAVARSVIRAAK